MARLAIVVGVALMIVGVGSYFGTGQVSLTALIPAFIGLPLAVLGALGLAERRRKWTMHVAVVIALIGLAGPLVRIIKAVTAEGPFEVSAAFVAQLATAVICGVFVVLAVRSFIIARRAP